MAKLAGCSAPPGGDVEARVYRVFTRREVLAVVRLILKGAVRIRRQIHEIRLPGAKHGIDDLAHRLREMAGTGSALSDGRWYAGPDGNTSELERQQRVAYAVRGPTCPH